MVCRSLLANIIAVEVYSDTKQRVEAVMDGISGVLGMPFAKKNILFARTAHFRLDNNYLFAESFQLSVYVIVLALPVYSWRYANKSNTFIRPCHPRDRCATPMYTLLHHLRLLALSDVTWSILEECA